MTAAGVACVVEKLGMVVTVPEVEPSVVAAATRAASSAIPATTDSQSLVLEDVLFDELKDIGKVERMYDISWDMPVHKYLIFWRAYMTGYGVVLNFSSS